MLGKNNPQIDIFTHMIFERLMPRDHLLVLINSIIDFSFVYDMVKDKYSDIGRTSEDPVMMLKICLLEFLYTLSDKKVVKRIQKDIAFRWFLGLALDDEVPDNTTICHFRTNRMGEENFDEFFNEIVRRCIKNNIVKSKRYLNVEDEKKLVELIEKVEENLGLKPEEITTDKVYGTTDNRAY